jgi:hypothetical protein
MDADEKRIAYNERCKQYYYANKQHKNEMDLTRYYRKKAKEMGIEVHENHTIIDLKRKIMGLKIVALL